MSDFVSRSYNMELHHVLNRGVDKRSIFLDNQDRARFVHNLFEFNDKKQAQNTSRHVNDLRSRSSISTSRLVQLHGWCVMGNHYHLLLSEIPEGGLTTFIRKLNIGYAKYFNEKYKRSGTLFQGRTKKVLVNRNAHFLHILHYIHLNPLDFLAGAKHWREGHIDSRKKALAHLTQYRWSSYLDYCGEKNFPSILTKDIFADVFPNYKKAMHSYIQEIEMEALGELILE